MNPFPKALQRAREARQRAQTIEDLLAETCEVLLTDRPIIFEGDFIQAVHRVDPVARTVEFICDDRAGEPFLRSLGFEEIEKNQFGEPTIQVGSLKVTFVPPGSGM